MSKRFTLNRESRDVASLSIHPLVLEIGYIRPDELFLSDLRHFGLYKPVIITDDGFCITMPDYIDAAKQNGEKDVDALVIKGATYNDLLRLINFESRMSYRASKTILFKTIRLLEKHLWNTEEGKEWAKELKGDSIDEKIGSLVGYGDSTVALIKYIGKNDFALLDTVDDPDNEMTLTKAKQIVKENLAINAKKDNFEDVVFTNLPAELSGEADEAEGDEEEDFDDPGEGAKDVETDDDGDGESAVVIPAKPAKVVKDKKPAKSKAPCDVRLTDFSVGLGRYGDFKLDLKTGRPAILWNDRFAGHVSITPAASNDPDEGVQFVIQHIDSEWSFQVVARRITKIVKEEGAMTQQP